MQKTAKVSVIRMLLHPQVLKVVEVKVRAAVAQYFLRENDLE